jgi:hypothetical protein
MTILRRSRIGLTMESYAQVPDKTTRDALRRLSDLFDLGPADEPATPASEPGRGDEQDKAQ